MAESSKAETAVLQHSTTPTLHHSAAGVSEQKNLLLALVSLAGMRCGRSELVKNPQARDALRTYLFQYGPKCSGGVLSNRVFKSQAEAERYIQEQNLLRAKALLE